MNTPILAVATIAFVAAAGPALAQFAQSGGAASTGPNISGAGTGLSAPSNIQSGGPGMSNPNAILTPAAPNPVQPVYPGVGIGGAGLPPAAVMPRVARTPRPNPPRPH